MAMFFFGNLLHGESICQSENEKMSHKCLESSAFFITLTEITFYRMLKSFFFRCHLESLMDFYSKKDLNKHFTSKVYIKKS